MIKMTLLKTFMNLIGTGCIVFGAMLTSFGLYGLAGGTGIQYYIDDKQVTPQEGGQLPFIVGLILLGAGLIITSFYRKKMR